MAVVRKLFANFFKFSGRLDRKYFWLMSLALVGIYIPLFITWVPFIEGLIHQRPGPIGIAARANSGFGFVAVLIVLAGTLLLTLIWASAISLVVRRLHDRNRSGWWVLPLVILNPTFHIQPITQFGWIGFLTLLLTWGVGIWYFVDIGLLKGTVGMNKYGRDPTSDGPVDPIVFGQ